MANLTRIRRGFKSALLCHVPDAVKSKIKHCSSDHLKAPLIR